MKNKIAGDNNFEEENRNGLQNIIGTADKKKLPIWEAFILLFYTKTIIIKYKQE